MVKVQENPWAKFFESHFMTKEEVLVRLHEVLKPGDTVHTILRHVARSGMYRRISLVKISKDGETCQLDHLCERLGLGKIRDRTEGLGVSGCGMDMGFHLVYELSARMFPNGFGCIGENCPSNDHSNGDRDYTPHPGCGEPDKRGHRDHWHNSGGYALRHRWL